MKLSLNNLSFMATCLMLAIDSLTELCQNSSSIVKPQAQYMLICSGLRFD